MYQGPDVHNPCYDLPSDAVDVEAIVSGRRRLLFAEERHDATTTKKNQTSTVRRRSLKTKTSSNPEIVPGEGWEVVDELPGDCDGTFYSTCGREETNKCPALGHQDSRGSIVGNEYSGWLVLDLPSVKEGLIIIKLFSWLPERVSVKTKDWTTVNNEKRLLNAAGAMELKDLPETFEFDYAIDGKITTLNKQDFIKQRIEAQRVVELWVLLDDPNFSKDDVEVAFRMRGCGRDCTFGLTHIYWA
jgi:hypothetical protein